MKPIKPKQPTADFLLAAAGNSAAALPLAADLLRNASLIAWPRQSQTPPPPMRVALPLDGRGMSAAFLATMNDLELARTLDKDEFAALSPGAVPTVPSGTFFDLDRWTKASFVLLKAGQCRLAAVGREHTQLMSRYLALPGPFHDPDGFNEARYAKWRDDRRGQMKGQVWTGKAAAAFTALALPVDLPHRTPAAQIEIMREVLGEGAAALYAPHFDSLFPKEFFTMFWNFSEHSDAQILRTVQKIAPLLRRSDRIENAVAHLALAKDASGGFLDRVLAEAAKTLSEKPF